MSDEERRVLEADPDFWPEVQRLYLEALEMIKGTAADGLAPTATWAHEQALRNLKARRAQQGGR